MCMDRDEKVVYVVHSVDTEGPLYESVQATFDRINNIYGTSIKASRENLKKLQQKEIDLGGKEEQIATILGSGLITYNDNYQKIADMLEKIGSSSYRNKLKDSYGNGWLYNWHCVDHIGYSINPRRKDIGFHNIFDYYTAFIKETEAQDTLHWHFHPMHWSHASHISATSYLSDYRFFDIIARRIIERKWFPSVNRAGFHTERPDSHWVLEQWMPFDLSNQAMDEHEDNEQDDLSDGRFGDWRHAPKTWGVYNPSHDDYQVEGNCRRYIGRCLNVGTRLRLLQEKDVFQAFDEANKNGKALMAFTNHDFRNMAPDVDMVRDFLVKAQEKYPDVKFKYCDAREAFNRFIWGEYKEPESNILSVRMGIGANESQHKLIVDSSEETFGPQPFLAIETNDGRFYHDNFDFQKPFRKWSYVFDYQSHELENVKRIGVGVNDKRGFSHVVVLNLENGIDNISYE